MGGVRFFVRQPTPSTPLPRGGPDGRGTDPKLREEGGEWLIKGVLESTLADVLAGMKYYYETGNSPSDTLREQFRQKVMVL